MKFKVEDEDEKEDTILSKSPLSRIPIIYASPPTTEKLYFLLYNYSKKQNTILKFQIESNKKIQKKLFDQPTGITPFLQQVQVKLPSKNQPLDKVDMVQMSPKVNTPKTLKEWDFQKQMDQLAEEIKNEMKLKIDSVQKKYQQKSQKQAQVLKDTMNKIYQKEKLDQEEKRLQLEQEKKLAKEKEIAEQKEKELREKKELELKRKEQEQKEKEQLEKEKLEAEQKQKSQQEALKASLTEAMPYKGSSSALEQIKKYQQILKDAKELKLKVKQDRQMMTEALRYRMAFTKKVGAVTFSRSHIKQFFAEIDEILSKGKNSQMLYEWLLNNLAKQISKQCENEISVNHKKAFALAALTLLILTKHPDFWDFLLSRLFKKCIYIFPVYPSRLQNETDDQFRKKMGYLTEPKLESEEQFQERMGGLVCFYFTLLRMNLNGLGFVTANPIPNKNLLWLYTSRLLNQAPKKITAKLLEVYLEVLSTEMMKHYPKQFPKLLNFIQTQFIKKLPEASSKSCLTKIQLYLEEYQKSGRIKGLEMDSIKP